MRDISPARPPHRPTPEPAPQVRATTNAPLRHTQVQSQRPSNEKENASYSRRTRKLLLYFCGPIAGIIGSILLFAIVSAIVNVTGMTQGGIFQTLSNTLIFIVGAVSVLLLPVGLIMGFITLGKGRGASVSATLNVKSAEITLEAGRGWNWGAFFLTWIWGLANGVPQALLIWIPFFGLVYAFILGAKGNQWAWEGRDWDSLEQFRSTQRKWATWGTVVFFVLMTLAILPSVAASIVATYLQNYH
jgi:hypothetical protein